MDMAEMVLLLNPSPEDMDMTSHHEPSRKPKPPTNTTRKRPAAPEAGQSLVDAVKRIKTLEEEVGYSRADMRALRKRLDFLEANQNTPGANLSPLSSCTSGSTVQPGKGQPKVEASGPTASGTTASTAEDAIPAPAGSQAMGGGRRKDSKEGDGDSQEKTGKVELKINTWIQQDEILRDPTIFSNWWSRTNTLAVKKAKIYARLKAQGLPSYITDNLRQAAACTVYCMFTRLIFLKNPTTKGLPSVIPITYHNPALDYSLCMQKLEVTVVSVYRHVLKNPAMFSVDKMHRQCSQWVCSPGILAWVKDRGSSKKTPQLSLAKSMPQPKHRVVVMPLNTERADSGSKGVKEIIAASAAQMETPEDAPKGCVDVIAALVAQTESPEDTACTDTASCMEKSPILPMPDITEHDRIKAAKQGYYFNESGQLKMQYSLAATYKDTLKIKDVREKKKRDEDLRHKLNRSGDLRSKISGKKLSQPSSPAPVPNCSASKSYRSPVRAPGTVIPGLSSSQAAGTCLTRREFTPPPQPAPPPSQERNLITFSPRWHTVDKPKKGRRKYGN